MCKQASKQALLAALHLRACCLCCQAHFYICGLALSFCSPSLRTAKTAMTLCCHTALRCMQHPQKSRQRSSDCKPYFPLCISSQMHFPDLNPLCAAETRCLTPLAQHLCTAAAGLTHMKDATNKVTETRKYFLVVLDTVTGAQLWEMASEHNEYFWRLWRLCKGREWPLAAEQLFALTFCDGTAHNDHAFWDVLKGRNILWEITTCRASPDGKWLAVLSTLNARDETNLTRTQMVIMHWPSGQVRWRRGIGALTYQELFWDESGHQIGYFVREPCSHHGVRLCVRSLDLTRLRLGLPGIWSVRSPVYLLHALLGSDACSPSITHTSKMVFSPSGSCLAVAASYSLEPTDMRARSAEQWAIVTVDTSHPDLPICAWLDVHERMSVVVALEWAPDSSALCAVCKCFDEKTGTPGLHEATRQTFVLRFTS